MGRARAVNAVVAGPSPAPGAIHFLGVSDVLLQSRIANTEFFATCVAGLALRPLPTKHFSWKLFHHHR